MLGSAVPLRRKANACFVGIRAKDWIGYLGMCLVGYGFGVAVTPASAFDPLLILKSHLSCALFLSFCFLINNYADVDSDRLDLSKMAKNPIASGLMNSADAVSLSVAAATCGFAVSTTMPNWTSIAIYLALAALGWAYSVPPLRLKGRPVADVVSHGFMLGVFLFFYGYSSATSGLLSTDVQLVGMSMFTCSAIFELRNHLHDLSADAISGTVTTVGWLGEQASKRLLFAITFVHLVLLTMILVGISSYAAYFVPPGLVLLGVLVITKVVSPARAFDYVTVAVYFAAMIPKLVPIFLG